MIIFEGLTKTYNKNQPMQVEALKGISCSFPTQGMVFVVGKSGCGKSTLLNVLGLLDSFDEGNILWDGEPIKGLSERQRAQHRNLNIGFVFQEYNLLEQYSVRKNIELVLELQGEKEKRDIAKLLETVDLNDMQNRNVMELSGGQKQRVAIARALVKNPKVLLCDEPTGSLDYETGRAIFALLKKVSKNSLVIVVSHDKEAANEYADKIIELRDGQVLNEYDLPKDQNSNDNVQMVDSADRAKKSSADKKRWLFKSRFKLAIGYFLRRPIRLMIALILCIISFVLLGISSSAEMIHREDIITRTIIQETDIPFLSYKKNAYQSNGDMVGVYNMTDEDVTFLKEKLNTDKVDVVYDIYRTYLAPYAGVDYARINSNYYHTTMEGFAEITESFLRDYGLTLYGSLPQADDEVVISKYIFDFFKEYGYRQSAGSVAEKINVFEDIYGKTLEVTPRSDRILSDKISMKIVGVVDTKFNKERYSVLLQDTPLENKELLTYEMNSMMAQGLHNVLFFKEGYYARNIPAQGVNELNGSFAFVMEGEQTKYRVLHVAEELSNYNIYYNSSRTETEWKQYYQSGKGIILPIRTSDIELQVSLLVSRFVEDNFEDSIKEVFKNKVSYQKYILELGNQENEYHPGKNYAYFLQVFLEQYVFTSAHSLLMEMSYTGLNPKSTGVYIVGYYETDDANTMLCSEAFFKEFIEDLQLYIGDYAYAVTPITGNFDVDYQHIVFGNEKIKNQFKIEEGDETYYAEYNCYRVRSFFNLYAIDILNFTRKRLWKIRLFL